jgi:hypothetical protein
MWETQVQKTLNEQRPKGEYILLRSGQLVGTALMLFIKSRKIPYVKRVDGSIKKTGLKGMAGNKGAIAIRLEYGTTSICFVTAHLAAGHNNVEQRNLDYHTIDHGIHFTRRRAISDHDLVFWASDSNYRIDLSNEEVRHLITEKRWDTLYENDQLNLGMVAGETFRYYNEGKINFPPTYKFDNGTDQYDTSEKNRVPAWTDRILYKGQGLKQLEYHSADLKMSDHRPVYATFKVQCRIVEDTKREKLAREIYEKKKNMIGDVLGGDVEQYLDTDGKRMLFRGVANVVPPPSSDKRKWWLDHNASSRVDIPKPPGDGWQLNPNRPTNPFDPTTESDWIKIPTDHSVHEKKTPPKTAPAPPPRRQQSERLPPSSQDQPPRRASTLNTGAKPKPIVPPKPSFISGRASLTASPSPSEEEFKPKPPLPPRTPAQDEKPVENEKVGLLMDDEEGGTRIVGGWVPLQPSKEL